LDKYKTFKKKLGLILHRKSEHNDKKTQKDIPHSTNKRMSDYNKIGKSINHTPYIDISI
jgi:hypothetical protein